MKWAIIISIMIAVFGFIPGMGLPGALVMTVANLCISPFHKLQCMEMNQAWGAALFATWIFPVFIPFAYYAGFKKIPKKFKYRRYAVFLFVLFVGSLATAGLVEMKSKAEKEAAKNKPFYYKIERPFKRVPR
tara:strand:- start:71 stop:466 length:396 start_codon:yes stop_codon:yes gene_type:complete